MTQVTGDWLTDPSTQKLCGILAGAGFQAFFVGGCVRNALMGVPVSDIDLATDAHPDRVVAVCEAAGLKVVPTGIDHGTVTVIEGGIPHEITTFRDDVETDGRRAVVAFSTSISEDARRRDFTMNALYAQPDGTLVDPLGGLSDLKARRVRFIEDPAQRIKEDYLRILRFFRFHAWYGDPSGGLDPDGLAAIAANLEGLSNLSQERVGSEIIKILAAPDPAPAVAAMRATGVLGHVLPGSDDRALAPLVHLETEQAVAPDAIRRLAAVGASKAAGNLRLSKADTTRLARLHQGVTSAEMAHELGYRDGYETARDIFLLRAVLLENPVDAKDLEQAKKGAGAEFPLRANDLMPDYTGPALGAELKKREMRWVASGFTLTRDQLLA